MAERRMLSKRVIGSARFLRMPVSSQCLYFHLSMNADDDGIVEAFPIMRMMGCTEDDLKILCAKGFVKVLNDDLVTYILDWRENNKIRADRKIDSIYKDLLLQVLPEAEIQETRQRADRVKVSEALPDAEELSQGQPTDDHGTDSGQAWDDIGTSQGQPTDDHGTDLGPHRIGKDRIGKDRIGQDRLGQDRLGQDRLGQDSTGEVPTGPNIAPEAPVDPPKPKWTIKQAVNNFTHDAQLKSALLAFFEMRKKMRVPNTEHSTKLLLDKLRPYSLDIQLAMVNKSIERGWRGLFDLQEADLRRLGYQHSGNSRDNPQIEMVRRAMGMLKAEENDNG